MPPLVPQFRRGALVLGLLLLGSGAPPPDSAPEGPFLAETEASMTKMHVAMDVRPTGDVDADFVAMMVPHHQGAIDMAQSLLRYGRNEQLRRIAQEIIVEQQQEIAAMRLALGQPLRPSVAAPDQPSARSAQTAPPPGAHHRSMPPQKAP
jgi:hypothetical protein